jgi:hypothetical protein
MWTFSARSRASNQSNQQETTDEGIGGDNGELVRRHGGQGRMRTEASSFGAELHLTLTAPTTRGDQSEGPSPTLNTRYVPGPKIHTVSAITEKLVEPLNARTGRRRCTCGCGCGKSCPASTSKGLTFLAHLTPAFSPPGRRLRRRIRSMHAHKDDDGGKDSSTTHPLPTTTTTTTRPRQGGP